MRRAALIFVILLALSIAGICCAHVSLSSAQDDVSFTPIESYGDESAADGLRVSVRAQMAQHLIWDSAHYFGQEAQTLTDFSFSAREHAPHQAADMQPLSISLASNPSNLSVIASGTDISSPEEGALPAYIQEGYVRLVRDVASRTENGSSHTELISFSDYYDYYPIYVELPAEPYFYYENKGKPSVSLRPNALELCEAFSGYFRFPVPEGHMLTISVSKDSRGNIVDISSSGNNSCWINALSVETPRGVYFALATEGISDFSGIKGGFGIYLLPVSSIYDGAGEARPTLDYNSIQTVFPLSDSAFIRSLTLSEDAQALNLVTYKSSGYYLTVIDIETMTQMQKIPLFEGARDYDEQLIVFSDRLLYVQLGDNSFALAERGEDNLYAPVLSGVREQQLSDNYNAEYNVQLAWDGERLALVSRYYLYHYIEPEYEGGYISYATDSCGFLLEIYGKDGQRYKGLYESSLDALASERDYSRVCHLYETEGLLVSW